LIASEILHKNGEKNKRRGRKERRGIFFKRFLIFFFLCDLGDLCVNINFPLCSGSSGLGIL